MNMYAYPKKARDVRVGQVVQTPNDGFKTVKSIRKGNGLLAKTLLFSCAGDTNWIVGEDEEVFLR